jgi:hypothetical protein
MRVLRVQPKDEGSDKRHAAMIYIHSAGKQGCRMAQLALSIII